MEGTLSCQADCSGGVRKIPVQTSPALRWRRFLDCDPSSALCPPSAQGLSAASGSHPGTESVCSLSPNCAWLIGTFHRAFSSLGTDLLRSVRHYGRDSRLAAGSVTQRDFSRRREGRLDSAKTLLSPGNRVSQRWLQGTTNASLCQPPCRAGVISGADIRPPSGSNPAVPENSRSLPQCPRQQPPDIQAA